MKKKLAIILLLCALGLSVFFVSCTVGLNGEDGGFGNESKGENDGILNDGADANGGNKVSIYIFFCGNLVNRVEVKANTTFDIGAIIEGHNYIIKNAQQEVLVCKNGKIQLTNQDVFIFLSNMETSFQIAVHAEGECEVTVTSATNISENNSRNSATKNVPGKCFSIRSDSDASASAGEKIAVVVTVKNGNTLKNFEVITFDGKIVECDNPTITSTENGDLSVVYFFVMPAASVRVSAICEKAAFKIATNFDNNSHNYLTSDIEKSCEYGKSITFTITACKGYALKDLIIKQSSRDTQKDIEPINIDYTLTMISPYINEISFIMPKSDIEIIATSQQIEYVVTFMERDNDNPSQDNQIEQNLYYYNEVVTITLQPQKDGYTFAEFKAYKTNKNGEDIELTPTEKDALFQEKDYSNLQSPIPTTVNIMVQDYNVKIVQINKLIEYFIEGEVNNGSETNDNLNKFLKFPAGAKYYKDDILFEIQPKNGYILEKIEVYTVDSENPQNNVLVLFKKICSSDYLAAIRKNYSMNCAEKDCSSTASSNYLCKTMLNLYSSNKALFNKENTDTSNDGTFTPGLYHFEMPTQNVKITATLWNSSASVWTAFSSFIGIGKSTFEDSLLANYICNASGLSAFCENDVPEFAKNGSTGYGTDIPLSKLPTTLISSESNAILSLIINCYNTISRNVFSLANGISSAYELLLKDLAKGEGTATVDGKTYTIRFVETRLEIEICTAKSDASSSQFKKYFFSFEVSFSSYKHTYDIAEMFFSITATNALEALATVTKNEKSNLTAKQNLYSKSTKDYSHTQHPETLENMTFAMRAIPYYGACYFNFAHHNIKDASAYSQINIKENNSNRCEQMQFSRCEGEQFGTLVATTTIEQFSAKKMLNSVISSKTDSTVLSTAFALAEEQSQRSGKLALVFRATSTPSTPLNQWNILQENAFVDSTLAKGANARKLTLQDTTTNNNGRAFSMLSAQLPYTFRTIYQRSNQSLFNGAGDRIFSYGYFIALSNYNISSMYRYDDFSSQYIDTNLLTQIRGGDFSCYYCSIYLSPQWCLSFGEGQFFTTKITVPMIGINEGAFNDVSYDSLKNAYNEFLGVNYFLKPC